MAWIRRSHGTVLCFQPTDPAEPSPRTAVDSRQRASNHPHLKPRGCSLLSFLLTPIGGCVGEHRRRSCSLTLPPSRTAGSANQSVPASQGRNVSRRKPIMRVRIVLAVIVVLAIAAGTAAQTTTATISGRVLDGQGGALPGAIEGHVFRQPGTSVPSELQLSRSLAGPSQLQSECDDGPADARDENTAGATLCCHLQRHAEPLRRVSLL